MSNVNDASTAMRQRLNDNIPSGIMAQNISWPNMPIDKDANSDTLSLAIMNLDRERVTLGASAREYRITGVVTLSVYSPREKHTVTHDAIVDEALQIYDEVILRATNVTIEFFESRALPSREDEGFWRTDILTDYQYTEFL